MTGLLAQGIKGTLGITAHVCVYTRKGTLGIAGLLAQGIKGTLGITGLLACPQLWGIHIIVYCHVWVAHCTLVMTPISNEICALSTRGARKAAMLRPTCPIWLCSCPRTIFIAFLSYLRYLLQVSCSDLWFEFHAMNFGFVCGKGGQGQKIMIFRGKKENVV